MKKYKGYADGGIVEDDEQPAAPPTEPDYTKALTDYFGQQKQAIDKYGPDQQKTTYDYITQSQNSLGNRIGRGAAGFADAIMQGVAGAGNPGFEQNIENRQARQLQNAEEEGKSLNNQNLAAVKEKTALDQMTTGNPLGESRAAAMRPLLQQIYPTLKPQELDSILQNPSAAEAALGPAVNLKEAEAKIEEAKSNRDFQHMMAAENLGQRKTQFDQTQWNDLVKSVDPATASSRTPLGVAAKADFNANRALTTLSKPVVTNQEAGNVMADIASIYQNGSPTQFGMSEQKYQTLYGKLANALQSVTGKPTDAMPNDVKERLIGVLQDMKKNNAGIIRQQLDLIEKTKGNIIANHRDEWKDLRDTLEGGGEKYTGIPGGETPGQPPTISSQQEYDALPSGATYMANGVLHRKK